MGESNGETGGVSGDNGESADVKKAVEVNPITEQTPSKVGMSIIAVLGVLVLILIFGIGYFRNKRKNDGDMF